MLTLILLAASAITPVPATCVLPDGYSITLEVAVSDSERALGLMFRDHLAADKGMIFVFEEDGRWPFWMKNTVIPLDFIWLDATGRIVDIASDVPPCRRDPCPSYMPNSPSRAMLEVNGGLAAGHGLARGDRLRWANVDGFPVPE